MEELENNELVLLNEENIKDMIYEIRGQKVMLDFDLARIYGYTTKAFNQQIKAILKSFQKTLCFKFLWKNLNVW